MYKKFKKYFDITIKASVNTFNNTSTIKSKRFDLTLSCDHKEKINQEEIEGYMISKILTSLELLEMYEKRIEFLEKKLNTTK